MDNNFSKSIQLQIKNGCYSECVSKLVISEKIKYKSGNIGSNGIGRNEAERKISTYSTTNLFWGILTMNFIVLKSANKIVPKLGDPERYKGEASTD